MSKKGKYMIRPQTKAEWAKVRESSVAEAQAVWAAKAKAKAVVAAWGGPQPTRAEAQVSSLTQAYRVAWDKGDPRAKRLRALRDRVLAHGPLPPAQVRAAIG